MTALRPRPYQQEAIDAVEAAWARGVRRPVVVAATGLGKTVIFSHVAQRFAERTGLRTLVLAHRAELLDQAAAKIRDVAPDLKVGLVAAEIDETDADVIVGSVQTLRLKHRRVRLDDIGLVITDEAHHSTSASYRAIYDHFPQALGMGVTATLNRADGAALGTVWDEIVAEFDVLFGIKNGFLSDIRGITVEVDDLDLSKVKTSRGDFSDGDLGEAMELSMAPEVVTRAYLEHAAGRSAFLFAPTIAVAELMAHKLNEAGVLTEVVTGSTPKQERRDIFRRVANGTTKVLSNVGVATEGTDIPRVSCILLCRPTKSKGLFVQMAGRALRPFPGKDHALLIDVAGATAVNNLCSLSTLAGRTVKEGQSLVEAELDELDEAAKAAKAKPIHDGPVAFRDVDLFAASRWRWRKTAGGIAYLATGTAYVFVMPGAPEEGEVCDDECEGCYCHLGHPPCGHCVGHCGQMIPSDTYDVGWLAAKGWINGVRGGNVRESVSELGTAMEWAEQAASEFDPEGTIGEKDRAWHKRKASDKQVAFARQLGIAVRDGARMLEVSDAIDAVMASRAIDSRILPFLAKSGRLAG